VNEQKEMIYLNSERKQQYLNYLNKYLITMI